MFTVEDLGENFPFEAVNERPKSEQKPAEVAPSFTGEQPVMAVSYTHLRAHETVLDLVCRLLLEKKNNKSNIVY